MEFGARSWLLMEGWKMVAALAQVLLIGGVSGGVAVLARRAVTLAAASLAPYGVLEKSGVAVTLSTWARRAALFDSGGVSDQSLEVLNWTARC